MIKYKDKVQNSNVQMVAYNKNNVQIGLILQQTNKERHIRNFSEILLNLTQMAKGMARILAEGHVNLYWAKNTIIPIVEAFGSII